MIIKKVTLKFGAIRLTTTYHVDSEAEFARVIAKVLSFTGATGFSTVSTTVVPAR